MDYRNNDNIGEISGYRGKQAKKYNDMLIAGRQWLADHPGCNIVISSNSMGFLRLETPDTNNLADHIVDAVDQPSLAMIQEVMIRLYIRKNGYAAYRLLGIKHGKNID